MNIGRVFHPSRLKSSTLAAQIQKGMDSLTGLEARLLLRKAANKRKQTLGWCKDVKQANIAILPEKYAKDFSKFAKFNSGALPILYESKVGEKGCALSVDSDITTDLPAYKIWKDGEMVEIADFVNDLDWSQMVTFYIGCSFSFDGLMMENGLPIRSLEQNREISMYKTTKECYGVGPFNCTMVVSMRPIPEHQLSLAADITSQMKDVHGAPVHIGNPNAILHEGKTLDDVDFGNSVILQEGDIPVFWACGVTNSQAIKAAKCPLAITHCPGMMYFTDAPAQTYNNNVPDNEKCEVIKYSDKGQRYSMLSVASQNVLRKLEKEVAEDPAKRGIEHLIQEGDFTKAALALSHASSVALITGFPVFDTDPPDETDGLPGIYSLAAILQAMGIKFTQIVDHSGLELNLKIMKNMVKAGILKTEFEVVPYIDSTGQPLSLCVNGKQRFDLLLASERVGRSASGKYYTMKGKDVSTRLDPIDNLFEQATKRSDIITIGIGDGGNELGMGKCYQNVVNHIPLGEKIACDVSADLLICGGTSNWGCQALSLALYALRRCSIHERYQRMATGPICDADEHLGWSVPTIERERKILEIVEDAGIRDGVRPDQKMSVDGFTFDPTHSRKVQAMKKAIEL